MAGGRPRPRWARGGPPRDGVPRRILEAVADETAPNAIVQHRSPLHHMKLVEGRREDVALWGFDRPNDEGRSHRPSKPSVRGASTSFPPRARFSYPKPRATGSPPSKKGYFTGWSRSKAPELAGSHVYKRRSATDSSMKRARTKACPPWERFARVCKEMVKFFVR